tara:strand:+ start:339 stop:2480 length:2142 start_codon:yes stop_codon:yes gene_type:complete
MAQWRKVIVSGSNSELNNISSSGDFVLSTDGAKMKFGVDNEVTLTHQHNAGLLLSDESGIGTTKLSFGDAATFLQQQADGELGIDADVKVDITAPVVSMSADLFVSGGIHAVGDITFNAGSSGNITLGSGADDNISAAGDFISNIIPNASDSFNLGSNTQRWNDLFLSGSINATGGPHTINSVTTTGLNSTGATTIVAGAASSFSTSAGKLTIDGNGGIDIVGNAAEVDITTSGNVDIQGAAITLDGTTASNFTVASANLLLNTTTSGDIDISSAADLDLDGATVAIDSVGALSLQGGAASDFTTGAGTLTLSGAAGVIVTSTGGELVLNGAGQTVDLDGDTVEIDSSGTLSIDAAGATNLSTTTGDLTIEAGANNSKVVIKGDHESGDAIHIDANENANSVVNIDAGKFDVDASGVAEITSVGTMTITGGGVSKYGDDTGTLDFSGDGAVTDTGVTTYNLSPSSTFDIDAVGATTIDSDGNLTLGGAAVDVDADGGTLSLDGSTGINIGTAANVAIDLNSSTLDIDGTGAITIDTTNTGTGVTIGTATANVPIAIGNAVSEVTVGDNLNVTGNVVVTGDLDVNGTLTTIDTTNLQVKDAFVQLASGSTSQVNAGIIANTTADGKGSAFYYDGTDLFNRWALTGKDETSHNATGNVVPKQFVMTVSQSAASPAVDAVPGDFGDNDYSRRGMVFIQTTDTAISSSVAGDIWIYS